MKTIFCTVLFIISLNLTANAQECSAEMLLKKPGVWKAGMKGSIANVSPKDLIKEKAKTDTIQKMVASKYKPTGCQVTYANSFGKTISPGENWVADPYTYTMFLLRYLCDRNSKDRTKFYVDYSTPTTVTISANVIFSLDNLYATNIAPGDFRGYLKLKERPVLKDGYYFLGEEVVGDGHLKNKIKEYRWLITYSDTLPFSYVSRKEYLGIQKKRLERSLKDNPSEAQYTNKYLKNVMDFLDRPESELSETAICPWNQEERFDGFVEEGTRGSFIAVKPNLGYYHKKLPMSTPQFFSVVYTISHGDPVFEENMSAIQKAVDFGTLKKMLGSKQHY
jgi:hypothetical protein